MKTGSGNVLAAAIAVTILAAAEAHAWRDYGAAASNEVDVALASGGDVIVAGELDSVRRLDGANGVTEWHASFFQPGERRGLAVNAADEVVVSGTSYTSGYMFAGKILANGSVGWSVDIVSGRGYAVIASPDGSGDAIVAGSSTADFIVVRLSGVDGSTVWTYTIADPSLFDRATALVADGAAGVVAAGTVGDSLTVVRLDLATGGETWNATIDPGSAEHLLEIGGDFAVAGTLNEDFAVVRLDGASGLEEWRYTRPGNSLSGAAAEKIAVDGSGDLVAVGYLVNTTYFDFFAAKLAGLTGAEQWRRELGGVGFAADFARDVVVAADGTVVVAGAITPTINDSPHFTLRGFDGATGADRWQQRIDKPPFTDVHPDGLASSLVALGNEHLVAAGISGQGYLTTARFGIDGSPGLVRGIVLSIKDKNGDPTKRRIVMRGGRDNTIAVPPSGAGDPTVMGATVTVKNPTSGETAAFVIPPGSKWRALGNPPGSLGYKYVDRERDDGPCHLLLAKPGRSLKAVCNGNFGSIPFTLDEPSQGTVTATLEIGNLSPQCLAFGPGVSSSTLRKDAGTSNPGPLGSYKATAVAPPGTGPLCPP